MRRLQIAQVLAIGAMVALSGVACSPKRVLQPNLPPQTQLFVQYDAADGVPHTVYHVARLHWFGSDPDGFVQGYDIRFIWPLGDPNPAWTRTTLTDSLFVIPDTTGLSNPTFQVRAVDNKGLADPQPPQQAFSFSNLAPTVSFVDPPNLNEVTFATQTLDWVGIDDDGDAGLLSYRVWLEGNEANPHVLTNNEFTLPSSDFLVGGRLRAGLDTATVFVQAVDPGGRVSNIASVTWRVRDAAPSPAQRARLLLIDDDTSPGADPSNFDNFYNAAVTGSGIPAGSWSVQRLNSGRAFRSSKDLEQSFKLFDAVVWYRGATSYFSDRDTLLPRHSEAVGAYLDAGGKVFLESYDLIASGTVSGLLTVDFMRTYLGSDFLYRHKPFGSTDSLVSWSIAKVYVDTVGTTPVDRPAILHSSLFSDSLKSNLNSFEGLRVFGVRDTNNVVLWARDSTLYQRQKFSAAVAIQNTVAGGGKIIVTSVPIAPLSKFAGSTARFMGKVFAALGIQP